MTYRLYYWPTIQGRGEFVRLALEDAGLDYADIARDGDAGMEDLLALLDGAAAERPPFAPPFLKAGRLIIGQTANILLFLGDRHGLAPASEGGRLWVHQLQLTIADLVAEAHDAHHPISAGLYYEDQRDAARRRTTDFLDSRVPKFLGWFERVLARNPAGGGWLAGARRSYADLSLFQAVAGLRYAFPRRLAGLEADYPRVSALHDRVADRPRISAYLASASRIPFSEEGIFRHYPELDR